MFVSRVKNVRRLRLTVDHSCYRVQERRRASPSDLNIVIFVYIILDMVDFGELQAFKAEFFKALAHPLRIRILECPATGPRSVQELQEALSADQPTVSQQLAVLRTKNVVVTRKQGTVVNYDLRDPAIRELLEVARRLFNNQLIGSQSMLKALRREGRGR